MTKNIPSIKRKVTQYKNKITINIPKSILEPIGYDEDEKYFAKFWLMGKTICIRLDKRGGQSKK